MAEISEDVVQKRAKEYAERDGFAWELEYRGPKPYEPIQLRGKFLSDEQRQQYLDRARAELQKEAENA